MRFSVRFFATLAGSAALAFCGAAAAQAQSAPPLTTGNGTYISVDPLAGVRYDNRYDVSLGMAYDHMKAGPNLLQGANLGGLDLSASYWLSRHWGAEGSTRYYLGTSGAAPNSENIDGPFVSEFFFTAGPEWLGPHNKHGALIAHVLFGGVRGNFEQDLREKQNGPGIVQEVGFYNNQVAPAAIIGGHMDLNRSAHWVFRITPDAVVTRYGINYGTKSTQTDVNFALSVGVQYKFSKRR